MTRSQRRSDDLQDLGRVMADVMPQVAGRADGSPRSASSCAKSWPDAGLPRAVCVAPPSLLPAAIVLRKSARCGRASVPASWSASGPQVRRRVGLRARAGRRRGGRRRARLSASFTIAGRKAAIPSMRVVPKKTRPSSSTSRPSARLCSSAPARPYRPDGAGTEMLSFTGAGAQARAPLDARPTRGRGQGALHHRAVTLAPIARSVAHTASDRARREASARAFVTRKVGGGRRTAPAALAVSNEREAAVVRAFRPLCRRAITESRARLLPRDPCLGRQSCEEAEGAVDVNPGVVPPARSAIPASGSKSPVLTSPAFAITSDGAP